MSKNEDCVSDGQVEVKVERDLKAEKKRKGNL